MMAETDRRQCATHDEALSSHRRMLVLVPLLIGLLGEVLEGAQRPGKRRRR